MDLSIIIVNWNTKKCLANCLASIGEACPGLQYDVHVVDNASSDGSEEMVREQFPEVQLLQSGANLGFSKANNLILPQAKGRFIMLLNPDTVATKGAFRKLIQFAESKPDLAAVSPLLTDENNRPTITYGFFPSPRFHWMGFWDPLRLLRFVGMGGRVVHIPKRSDPSTKVDYIAGACFLMPRAMVNTIGLLDERFFMYFEETDWCLRARKAGKEIWYYSDAEVAHLEGQAAARVSLFSIRQLQKSYRQFVAKNYGQSKVGHYRIAQFFEYTLKAILRSLALRNRPKNMSLATGYRERARLQLQKKIMIEPPK
ncbi:MAG: glycosyltransferase family 2 protein [bacterium]|nr:glycosyltransferase family 2 protein [bacterium]